MDGLRGIEMKDKKLRVWHIPQVPGEPFCVSVDTLDEAKKIIRLLGTYDFFQWFHHIKPDYDNASGLEEWDETAQEWYEWYSEDGESIDELLNEE